MDCVFCKIVAKESPSYLLFEDDLFMAFLDIHPRGLGHTLVIPKKHFQWVYDVPEFGRYWEVALKITKAIQTSLYPEYISYVTHGIEIPHAHIHIVPRFNGERMFVPDIKHFSKEQMEETAELIRKKVSDY